MNLNGGMHQSFSVVSCSECKEDMAFLYFIDFDSIKDEETILGNLFITKISLSNILFIYI